jgi:hypothetical protein
MRVVVAVACVAALRALEVQAAVALAQMEQVSQEQTV